MMGASSHRSGSYSVKPVDFGDFTRLMKRFGPNTDISPRKRMDLLNEYHG
jgi:hypothetical protein